MSRHKPTHGHLYSPTDSTENLMKSLPPPAGERVCCWPGWVTRGLTGQQGSQGVLSGADSCLTVTLLLSGPWRVTFPANAAHGHALRAAQNDISAKFQNLTGSTLDLSLGIFFLVPKANQFPCQYLISGPLAWMQPQHRSGGL